ncbi:methyl-accepting chemotaxis protein [Thalassotalea piscium]
MSILLGPAVSLSNHLRFKLKFVLLASILFLPLLASFFWIIQSKYVYLLQYQQEMDGFRQINKVVNLEKNIALTRNDSTVKAEIDSEMASLQILFKETSSQHQFEQLSEIWQNQSNSLSATDFTTYNLFYEATVAIRENIAAMSGLSRESDAMAFYLAETTIQRLPALREYTARYKDLINQIINEGFTAQSYTLAVALDNRINELQTQLDKTEQQLKRSYPESLSQEVELIEQFNLALETWQKAVKQQVLDPEDISLTSQQAKRLADDALTVFDELSLSSDLKLHQRLETMHDSSESFLWLLSIALLILATGSSYLFLGVYRSLIINVKEINLAAERLGNGDFSVQLKINSCDELGDIGLSFSQMQNKIHVLLQGFVGDVNNVKQSASEIDLLTQEMANSIRQQRQNTHDVAQAVAQVSDSVTTIADNTSEATLLTEVANDNVTKGQVIIGETGAAINDIAEEVNASSIIINELAKNSSEIGEFVSVIREIADQTNLLALNAAIEAARAGEQGRGFAVVADEIRTLAIRTQDSTAKIQRIIEELQNGADRSVEAMNQGVEKARNGVEKTRLVEDTFSQVTNNVAEIVTATIEISAAVVEQKNMVSGINQNTDNIALGADQVTESSQKAAEASNNLSKLADTLTVQLAQFKL